MIPTSGRSPLTCAVAACVAPDVDVIRDATVNRTEMRTLGRIGQPLSGGSYRPRRRLRAPRWLLVVLAVAMVGLLWVGATANRQVAAEPQDVALQEAVPARPGG